MQFQCAASGTQHVTALPKLRLHSVTTWCGCVLLSRIRYVLTDWEPGTEGHGISSPPYIVLVGACGRAYSPMM